MKLTVLILAVLLSASITGCATTKGPEVSDEDAKECADVAARLGPSASWKAWPSTSMAWV